MEEKNATVLRICENIRVARMYAGFTQVTFAEKFGIKRSTYAEWETNYIPSVESMMKIAELTGFDLNTLVYGNLSEMGKIDANESLKSPERGAKPYNNISSSRGLLSALVTYSAMLGEKVFKKPLEDCIKEIEKLALEAKVK